MSILFDSISDYLLLTYCSMNISEHEYFGNEFQINTYSARKNLLIHS